MNDIKYCLLVCDYLVPKYAIATVISKALHFTVGRISTQYFFVEVRSWNLDIILSNIICQLHAKLNFGIFCYSLRWLKKVSTFCLKVIFFVAIALKKQKQIDDQLVDRDDPSSTFRLYVVKFGPNVAMKVWFFFCT